NIGTVLVVDDIEVTESIGLFNQPLLKCEVGWNLSTLRVIMPDQYRIGWKSEVDLDPLVLLEQRKHVGGECAFHRLHVEIGHSKGAIDSSRIDTLNGVGGLKSHGVGKLPRPVHIASFAFSQ